MADATTTIPLSGPINLIVRTGHGSVSVTARDDLAEATVHLSARDARSDVVARTVVEMRGPTLVVHAPRQGGLADLFGSRRNKDGIDVAVVIPTSTAVRLTTATAGIAVKGRVGGADVVTGSADIDLDTIDGNLRLRYGSSNSHTEAVTGSVTVRSGSGDARFGTVGGDVTAGFGSGDLSIDVANGSVRSRAGSGNANIGVTHGDIDLAAGSGNATIGLPAGLAARLEVTTGSGRVQSELPIEQTTDSGKPSITIRARTGSGNVRLFRAPNSHSAA